MAHDAPEGSAHHQDRGQDATAGPAAEAARPDDQLDDEQNGQGAHAELAEQLGVDGVVADAERPGIDEATETDDEPADHRPPHPVQVAGQLLEEVFGSVDGLGHEPGGEAAGDADRRRSEQDHSAERRHAMGPGRAAGARPGRRWPSPCAGRRRWPQRSR